MWTWRYEIAKIMFPRFCVVTLQLSQPFLIQRVIETLSDPDSIQARNHGYGLVGAVAVVYLGTAVSCNTVKLQKCADSESPRSLLGFTSISASALWQ